MRRFYSTTVLLVVSLVMSFGQVYHLQEDFESVSSDNFPGWVTSGEGVANTNSGINGKGGKFRGMTSAMETTSSYTNLKEIIFSIMSGSTTEYGASFTVYTSSDDGATWNSRWSVTQASLNSDGEIINQTIVINSGSTASKIKFESVIPEGTERQEYPFTIDDISLTREVSIGEDNTEFSSLTAACSTVSYEDITFTEVEPFTYVANDSISFDETNLGLNCVPIHDSAWVVYSKTANPIPGKADTSLFIINAADNTSSQEYKVVFRRSVYQCKAGFLEPKGNAAPQGWTVEGGNFASSSKGDGGLYPGENGMRIYISGSSSEPGILTTPEFSSISTLTFAAKFSKSDDETLQISKSTNSGTTWELLKTYTPGEGEIPEYSGETSDDTLAYQLLDIHEENVMIRFSFIGTSTTPRLMLDDIACKAIFTSDGVYPVTFRVYDLDHQAVAGATVTLNGQEQHTSGSGSVTYNDVAIASDLPYTISKDVYSISGTLSVTSGIEKHITLVMKNMDLFLALGQSNMAGRAPINKYVNMELDNVSLLNDDAVWVPASNPMNLYSNIRKDVGVQQVGPSYAFAKTLAKYTEKQIGMIVNARGGTNLSEFAKGGIYYEPTIKKIKEAQQYGQIKAVIWHQGEGNSGNAAAYMPALSAHVDNLRSEIGEDVYFVAGQLGPWDRDGTSEPKYGEINDSIAKISDYISHADYAKNDSLSDIGDNTHFNVKSQILLGQRYAQKVLAQLYSTSISIIDVNIEGEGYVEYEGNRISSENAYSYTSLATENAVFTIYAGEGKEFTQLTINDVTINEAAGDALYQYMPNTASDATLQIVMATQDVTSSIDQATQDVTYYPNPASENIYLSGTFENLNVKIFNMHGKVLLENKNHNKLDISNIKPGTYLIIITDNKIQHIRKLIVL
jgi:hypothetical protein